ncbi:MAG: NTP transferase domain-containing protein [Actinomycetota bacterium]|nr:NTP transferase domain-containing protein [Actinomycetota bacterium]
MNSQDVAVERQRYAVVMAAGIGSRMKSSRPKPLIRICGKPMIVHILEALAEADVLDVVIVVGHKADVVQEQVTKFAPTKMRISFVTQQVQRGTGDAVLVSMTALPDPLKFKGSQPSVIILPGDAPLIRGETIARMLSEHEEDRRALTVAFGQLDDPAGYGRLVFDKNGNIKKIVEEKDASELERDERRINSSFYVSNLDVLLPAVRRLQPLNAQGEYYFTDVVEVLASSGYKVSGFEILDYSEAGGVNDRAQLAQAEVVMRERINASFMLKGVNLVNPSSIYIDSTVEIGQDTTLWPGTSLIGRTIVGDGVEIGPDVRVANSIIGDRARIIRSELERCRVGEGAVVGPYAVMKSGSSIGDFGVSGSFVVLEQ